MKIHRHLALVLSAIGFGLSGCYEEPQTAFYEPGDYQGRTDPLLEKQASSEQQQRLEERLNLGQRDR